MPSPQLGLAPRSPLPEFPSQDVAEYPICEMPVHCCAPLARERLRGPAGTIDPYVKSSLVALVRA